MKSIKEFADELGVNERTVRRHISKLNMNELELIQEKFNFARDYIKEVIKNDE